MKTILITGFETWREEKYNPTVDLAREFKGKVIDGYRVRSEVLPVSFQKVRDSLPKLILKLRPSIIIHMGLAPRASVILIEKVAINLMDARVPDNDGYKPVDEPIFPDAPVAYFSTLPTRRIVEVLRKRGIPSALSYSAGTFLCNCALFVSLHTIHTYGLNTLAGFVHVPYTPKQAAEKQLVASMCMHLLLEGINVTIRECIKALSEKKS